MHAGKGLSIAATDGAKQRLVVLQQEQVAALEVPEESAATIEIARISKDEMGVRPLPVIGEYGQVTPLVSVPANSLSFSFFTLHCLLYEISCVRCFCKSNSVNVGVGIGTGQCPNFGCQWRFPDNENASSRGRGHHTP